MDVFGGKNSRLWNGSPGRRAAILSVILLILILFLIVMQALPSGFSVLLTSLERVEWGGVTTGRDGHQRLVGKNEVS